MGRALPDRRAGAFADRSSRPRRQPTRTPAPMVHLSFTSTLVVAAGPDSAATASYSSVADKQSVSMRRSHGPLTPCSGLTVWNRKRRLTRLVHEPGPASGQSLARGYAVSFRTRGMSPSRTSSGRNSPRPNSARARTPSTMAPATPVPYKASTFPSVSSLRASSITIWMK